MEQIPDEKEKSLEFVNRSEIKVEQVNGEVNSNEVESTCAGKLILPNCLVFCISSVDFVKG